MKDKIEVGEYVRTKTNIAKVIGKDDDNNIMLDNQQIVTKIEAKSIKHSKNIKNLIEEGDYVNGKQVKMNYENGKLVIPKHIKSIVTKEQFEQVQYKVGD